MGNVRLLMMGEKRFTVIFVDGDYLAMPYFFDNGEEISDYEVVDLLNEQQATISRLEEENIELKKLRKYCAEWMGVKEENLYDVVR